MIRATGLNRIPAHLRAVHERLGAIPLSQRLRLAGDDRPDLSRFLPNVMDQGHTSSCVGHAGAAGTVVATAASVALSRSTRELPFVPSPLDIYRLCRCLERPSPDVKLTDDGTNIADVVTVVTRLGVRPMQSPPTDGRYSDVTEANINDDPMLGDLEADGNALLLSVDAHPILSNGGDQMIADFDHGLSAGAPILIAVPGGSSTWQQYSGGILGPISAALDHCVLLYKLDLAARVGWIRGSWSADYGENGDTRVNFDFLKQSTGDAFALAVAVP